MRRVVAKSGLPLAAAGAVEIDADSQHGGQHPADRPGDPDAGCAERDREDKGQHNRVIKSEKVEIMKSTTFPAPRSTPSAISLMPTAR